MNDGWILGMAAFTTFLLALPVVVRMFATDLRVVEVIVGTGLANFAIWAALFASTFDRDILWGFLAIYGFLFMSFLQAFAIIFKSISLRMLVEIANKPGGTLSFDETHDSLIIKGAYARRLVNLEAGGFLVRIGSSVQLTDKGRKISHRILSIQRLFGIANSG